MEFNRETLKKMFPNLANELKTGENKTDINSVRTDMEDGENAVSERFAGYTPDVVDFIRRCDTTKQAEEIIVYMEKKGEISHQHAEKLRQQLKEKGVRSFGSKKEEDYYMKHGEL
jgi:hypothetical protein